MLCGYEEDLQQRGEDHVEADVGVEGAGTADRCPECGADLVAAARYCTTCGVLVAADDDPRSTARPPVVPTLVECDACGAGNAASRLLCARCQTPLRDEVPGGDALPEDAGLPAITPGRHRESPSLLFGLVVLAGLLTAGVLLSLVASRLGSTEAAEVPSGIEIRTAEASSAMEGQPARSLIDDDPSTAWASGDGEDDPWVELVLAEPSTVRRLLIWTGDQGDAARFTTSGRPLAVRLDIDGPDDDGEDESRQFLATMRDITGPQAIDLPEPVRASTVRITVERAAGGTRAGVAMSEVVIEE
jgi:hypothetical protein